MNKKTLLILLALLGLMALILGLYMYNKPLEDLGSATVAESLEATALYQAFEADEATANQRFLGKIVQVSGTVLDIGRTDPQSVSITLEAGGLLGGVLCIIDPAHADITSKWSPGMQVSLKGECTGMLNDVQLTRCVPIQ